MKLFVPVNKNGNVEISKKQLKDMLADAYKEGYVQGQIKQILNNAPDFAIAEDREQHKKKQFSESGEMFIFRATIL